MDLLEQKRLKRNRDIASFIMGVLSMFLLSCLGEILSNYTNIIENPDNFVIIFPIIYSIIVLILLDKFINDTYVPDLLFLQGSLFGLIFMFLRKVVEPYFLYNGQVENLGNILSFFFVVYVVPGITYNFAIWIWYYIQSIRLKFAEYMQGAIDNATDYTQSLCDEYKELDIKEREENGEIISNEEKETKADMFDITGNAIKNFSKILEDNINGNKKNKK